MSSSKSNLFCGKIGSRLWLETDLVMAVFCHETSASNLSRCIVCASRSFALANKLIPHRTLDTDGTRNDFLFEISIEHSPLYRKHLDFYDPHRREYSHWIDRRIFPIFEILWISYVLDFGPCRTLHASTHIMNNSAGRMSYVELLKESDEEKNHSMGKLRILPLVLNVAICLIQYSQYNSSNNCHCCEEDAWTSENLYSTDSTQ